MSGRMSHEEWEEARRGWIRARRCLEAPPGYATLRDVCLDGPWVTPPQKSSHSQHGLVLLAWHFLGAKDACKERDAILANGGYSAHRGFNRVLDMALDMERMGRDDIYLTQVFHLLPCAGTSFSNVPAALVEESWEKVTRQEVQGRVVVALGRKAENMYKRKMKVKPHDYAPHPGSRPTKPGGRRSNWTYERRAEVLAAALCRARKLLPGNGP